MSAYKITLDDYTQNKFNRSIAADMIKENKVISEKARNAYVEGISHLFQTAVPKAELFKRGFIMRFDFHAEPFVYVGDAGNSAAVNKTFAEWYKDEFDHLPNFTLTSIINDSARFNLENAYEQTRKA